MDSNVIRDPIAQEKFGKTLNEFAINMQVKCTSLKKHIAETEGRIKSKNAANAIQYLMALIQEIEKDLPGVQDVGAVQTKGAKILKQAEDMPFHTKG